MFHRSELGPFGQSLPADLTGNVPQDGDRPEQFVWDPRTEWTAAGWDEFVAAAVTATTEAIEASHAQSALLFAAGAIAGGLRAGQEADARALHQALRRVRERLAPLVEQASNRARTERRLDEESRGLEIALSLIDRYLDSAESSDDPRFRA